MEKISTTYLWFYKPTKELVGYVSVFTDAIQLRGELKEHFRRKDILFKTLPALKIGKLCVSDAYLGRGIGSLMIEFVIVLCERVGKEVGLRFITTDSKRNTDPKRDSIYFYRKFGFEVLKQLKSDPTRKQARVIVLSNLGQDGDIKKALQLGADDYFVKSQHPIEEVIEKIRGLAMTGKPGAEPKSPSPA